MNILFLTLLDINEKKPNSHPIYSDLVNYFRQQNHNMYAVCPIEKRHNANTSLTNENNINTLRVKIGNITKVNFIEKGFSTLRIESQYLRAIKKYFSNIKFDLVLYSTPPITFEKIVSFIKKRDNAKSYLLLKDIFPQNAVDLGMFSDKSLFYKYFRVKEQKLYTQSDFIGCMSQANVDYVINHNDYINSTKVEVCPNSINPLPISIDIKERGNIRKKYNIPLNKTVFVYGGNLGKPQGVDFLIQCLESNRDNQAAFFLIVGSGTEFSKIHDFIDHEKITNTKLFKQLPKKDYELLVSSCDVGLIFLDKRFTIPNFPSRLLSYMQASMPVLATTDVNSDIGKVIEKGQFGYWCESNDIEQFNKKVQQLCDIELRKNLGVNARRYLEDNYTVKHSYEIIMRHFNKKKRGSAYV